MVQELKKNWQMVLISNEIADINLEIRMGEVVRNLLLTLATGICSNHGQY